MASVNYRRRKFKNNIPKRAIDAPISIKTHQSTYITNKFKKTVRAQQNRRERQKNDIIKPIKNLKAKAGGTIENIN